MSITSLENQARAIHALCEGNSIRSTERMLGIHRDTIMRLALRVGTGCMAMHNRMIRGVTCNYVELDEIWAFVGCKEKRVDPNRHPYFYGDQYTFVAMDTESKLTIAYLTGKRTAENTQTFVLDLASRLSGRVQISTDGWAPYVNSICDAFGGNVDHGVMIKDFASDSPANAPAARRYSPGNLLSFERRMVTGNPQEQNINTSYVERQNLTMRMSMRRFTRLTNGFSKLYENLCAAVGLHFGYANLCRIHETTRVTPAIAAGLERRVWSVEELVEAALAQPAVEAHQAA